LKRRDKNMPRTKFVIEGDIKDFERIDNLYRTLRREGIKLLKNWVMTMESTYTEKEGEKEIT